MYYGLVSYRNRIGRSFSNKERGLFIIILMLLVMSVYSIEHLKKRIYDADNIARQLSEPELLLKSCLIEL